MSYDLRDAFQELATLNEAEEFNLSDAEQIQKMDDFMKGDEFDEVQMVIDVDAEGMDELQPSYEGKIIIQCPICKSLMYKDEADLVHDEDSEYVNVEDACPYCHEEGGYLIVGKVAPYPAEEEAEESEAEEEVEVEEEPAEEVPEEAEEEEVKESLTEATSAKVTDEIIKKLSNAYGEENVGSAKDDFGIKVFFREEGVTADKAEAIADQYNLDTKDEKDGIVVLLDESLKTLKESATQDLKEKVADEIYDILAQATVNLAHIIHHNIPEYDIDWCNDDATNKTAVKADAAVDRAARALADDLFAFAPMDESCSEEKLTEGSHEIDRKGFVSLIKYDDPTFAQASHGVLNDGNFVRKFWAKDDDEAKAIFHDEDLDECGDVYEDLDSDSLDKLISEKLGKKFVSESGFIDGNKITVEGKLGRKKASYVFEAKNDEDGFKLINENFTIKGKVENKNIICEAIEDVPRLLQKATYEIASGLEGVRQASVEVQDAVDNKALKTGTFRAAYKAAQEIDESKAPFFRNPRFDEKTYGKYFTFDEESGVYKLKPEMADEYLAILGKQMREIEDKYDEVEESVELDEKLPRELANAYRSADYNDYQSLYNSNEHGGYERHTRGQEYRYRGTVDDKTPSEVGPYIDYEKAEYTKLTPEEAKRLGVTKYKDLRLIDDNGNLVVLFGKKVNSKVYQGWYRLPDAPELFDDPHIASIYLTNERSPEARLSQDQVDKRSVGYKRTERPLGQHGGHFHELLRDYEASRLRGETRDMANYEARLANLEKSWDEGVITRKDYETQKEHILRSMEYAQEYIDEMKQQQTARKQALQDEKAALRYAESEAFLQRLHKEYEGLTYRRQTIAQELETAKDKLAKAEKGESSWEGYSWYKKDIATKKKDLEKAYQDLRNLQILIAQLEKETSGKAAVAELRELQDKVAEEQTKFDEVNTQIKNLITTGKTESLDETVKMSDIKGTVGNIIKKQLMPALQEVATKEEVIAAATEKLGNVAPECQKYAQEVLNNLKKKNFAQGMIYLGNVMLAGEGLRSPDAKNEDLNDRAGFETTFTVTQEFMDPSLWGMDEEELEAEVAPYLNKACHAVQSVEVGTGDPKDDYYDLTFADGHVLYGVSGEHLDLDALAENCQGSKKLKEFFEARKLDAEDIADWIYEHEQAAEDCEAHFGKGMFEGDLADVDAEDLLLWIGDHETLADDFKAHFGVSVEDCLYEDEDEDEEEFDESCTKKAKKSQLTERKWDATLESGSALRQAVDEEDIEGIVEALKNCYKEINRKLPDAMDDDELEDQLEDIDMAFSDPEEVDEDLVDMYLADFYDFCDGCSIWVEM